MPGLETVRVWCRDNAAFRAQYTQAREDQADTIFEELVEIVDDGSNDWMDKEMHDGRIERVVDHEHIQRSKLRFQARQWMLSKMVPKKYGDKIMQEITNPDGSLGGITKEEAAARIAALEAKVKKRKEALNAKPAIGVDISDLA